MNPTGPQEKNSANFSSQNSIVLNYHHFCIFLCSVSIPGCNSLWFPFWMFHLKCLANFIMRSIQWITMADVIFLFLGVWLRILPLFWSWRILRFQALNRSKLINITINWQTLNRKKCTGVSRAGERQNCHWFNKLVASYHTRLKHVTFVSCCWGRPTCTHACAGESWKLLTYHSILLISVCSLVLLCSEKMDDSVTLSPLTTLESEEKKKNLNQILT